MNNKELKAAIKAITPLIIKHTASEITAAVAPLRAEIAALRERVAYLEGKSGRDLADGAALWPPEARQ